MVVENLLLGADPELFLEKDGEIVSAEGLIGGTKNAPKKISDAGHAIQEDNVMIEFNIPPSDSLENFTDNIQFVKDYLTTLANVQGGVLNFSASAMLDPKYLQTEQAKLFGCDPDLNVWQKRVNDPPRAGGNLRTCGGHIHIGYDNPTQEVSEKIIYAMDTILGLESINLDKDDRRREMYGKAGCFRFKDYGVEYRTLSNFWIQSEELIKWAYEKTVEAIALVNSGEIDAIVANNAKIETIINNNDKKGAVKMLGQIEKLLTKVKIEK